MVRGGVIISVLPNFQDCYCPIRFAHQEFALWFAGVFFFFLMDSFQMIGSRSINQYADTHGECAR